MIIVQEVWCMDNGTPIVYCYPCEDIETAKVAVDKIKKEINENKMFMDGVFYHQFLTPNENILKYEDEEYIFELKDTKSKAFYGLYIGDDEIVTMDNMDETI